MGKEQELLDAARNGNLAVVERILNHRIKKSGPLASLRRGPGPNTQDSSGYTCLHHAALNGHKSVVSFLLQYDANPNIVDSKGSTALHLAAWTGNYDIVHIILTQSSLVPNVNLKNNDQETPLHSAAQYGHTSVVSLLLQHGSDPLVRNNKEESPLELASQYGRYETVDVLIRTRPNLVNDLVKKHSPLHLAAKNGHKNVVRLLLNAKFDVNYVTEKGTALHEAALYGKIEVVKLLLDYGIDVELEDDQRRTVMDLLKDINTGIAKQTKRIIKEHTTLVSTEDDSSTVISDSSSHCISPPPGYTDTTPEHHSRLPEKMKSISAHSQSPTSGFTSPANSEFNFYEVPPPPPRLGPPAKRSSGAGDDYVGAKNMFSRSQDSILDGYSTSSSRSPSFLDYEAAPPIPPREKFVATRVCKSSDSSYLLYEVPPPPVNLNGSYTCGSISRKEVDHQRPDSQSSTGTWSNHSSSGYVPMSGKPIPPAKPPRKSVPPMNRGLSQQQYHSKSQHQLHVQSNRSSIYEFVPISGSTESGGGGGGGGGGTMKRSASNDGDGYVEMRGAPPSNRFSTFLGDGKSINNQPIYANQSVRLESSFSALYDEIANGSTNCTSVPVAIPTGPSSKPSSLCRSYNANAPKIPTLHQRSKSEHHPRCPNYETAKPETLEESFMKHKRATVQIPVNYGNYDNQASRLTPPTAEQAEEGILNVMRQLNEISEDCDKACVNGWSPSSQSYDMDPLGSGSNDPESSDFEFYSFSSGSDDDDDLGEYKKMVKEDVGTVVDESVFPVVNERGKKIRVKLRNPQNKAKLKSRSVKVDLSLDGIVKEENPFAGLCRGSVQSRSSLKNEPNTKSLRRNKYSDSSTVERRKKCKSTPSKLKLNKPNETSEKPVTIEIKPIEMTVSPNNNWDTFPKLLPISPFDENKEWAEIENIMASFGSGLEKEIVFSDEEKENSDAICKLENKSVKEWLLSLYLPEYTDLLIVNGFDDLKFMGPNVMEDSDLIEIGILNEEHRKKILDSVKDIPRIKQLEPQSDITVEEWLTSLHLTDYWSRFRDNNFTNMNSVRNIWDVELNAVLEINKIGHRKRILASLGERLSLITDLGFDDLDFNKLSFEDGLLSQRVEEASCSGKPKESPSEFDTMTKSLSEDISLRSTLTKTDVMEGSKSSFCFKDDSSQDETASNRSSTQSIVSASTPLTMQWKHSPLDLHRNKCEYKAFYLGSTLVRQLQGIQSSNESIRKLKESTKNIKKIPRVILSIDYTGVRFIDAQTNVTVCEHEIRNIHFACQDADDFKHFAYITKEHETNHHYCHVFCAQNLDLATEIILTLGQAFEIAYRLALGEDIETLHQMYQANLVPSTPPAPPPRTSSFIATSAISSASTLTSSSISSSGHRSAIPKPISKPEANKNKPVAIPKLKSAAESKPAVKSKPVPPLKPASLVRSCPSPGGTLTKRGKS